MPSGARNSNPFMNENLILGIISVALCAYLLFAMVRPEKF